MFHLKRCKPAVVCDTLEECGYLSENGSCLSQFRCNTKWSARAEPHSTQHNLWVAHEAKQKFAALHIIMTIHQGAMSFVEEQENWSVENIIGGKSGTKIAKIDRKFRCHDRWRWWTQVCLNLDFFPPFSLASRPAVSPCLWWASEPLWSIRNLNLNKQTSKSACILLHNSHEKPTWVRQQPCPSLNQKLERA